MYIEVKKVISYSAGSDGISLYVTKPCQTFA